jgi:hypothetical protein
MIFSIFLKLICLERKTLLEKHIKVINFEKSRVNGQIIIIQRSYNYLNLKIYIFYIYVYITCSLITQKPLNIY